MAAAVNILLDCACSMKFAAADAGGGETYSGSISFKADKVSVKETYSTSDHSTAQDRIENHRITKSGWEVTVETKLGATSGLLASLRSNDLGQLIVTSTSGNGFTMVSGGSGGGVISDISEDYAGPSTLKFTLKAHGTALTFA